VASQFVVVLKDQRFPRGPFAPYEGAAEFAEFVTTEIDPAEVRSLSSPVGELLAWRRVSKERDRG
jgi:hypothetical protein